MEASIAFGRRMRSSAAPVGALLGVADIEAQEPP